MEDNFTDNQDQQRMSVWVGRRCDQHDDDLTLLGFLWSYWHQWGWDSVVDTTTSYRLQVRSSNSGGVRFTRPIQAGPEAHPDSCIVETTSVSWGWSSQVMELTTHSLLVPGLRMGRAVPRPPLCTCLACNATLPFCWQQSGMATSEIHWPVIHTDYWCCHPYCHFLSVDWL